MLYFLSDVFNDVNFFLLRKECFRVESSIIMLVWKLGCFLGFFLIYSFFKVFFYFGILLVLRNEGLGFSYGRNVSKFCICSEVLWGVEVCFCYKIG